jgi:simple sugar transport system permease protein
MLFLSDEPGRALYYLVAGPALSPMAFGNLLDRAALITLTGTGFALAFRAGSFNLGGEGQAFAGGLAAAAVALALPGIPRPVAALAAAVAGVVVGAFLGVVPGILRARWGVDELIATFLIAGAILPIGNVLLGGPMKDPGSYLIAAPPLPEAFRLTRWLPPSRIGPPLVWAVVAAAGASVFLAATRRGYEWRLRGAQEAFARYGGINVGRIAVTSLGVSGGLHGLAGGAALLGSYGQAVQGFTAALGWDGLAAALMARHKPLLIPIAAVAYAWLSHGARAAMIHTGFPFALGGVVQATVFLLVTARIAVGAGLSRRQRGEAAL